MSSGARIGLLVGTAAVLVLAFVLLSPGDDDEPQRAGTPTAAAPATAEPPQELTTIRVRNGEPSGGVQTITVDKGDRVRIQVSSQDTSDEIHVHGYELTRDLRTGDSVRLSFVADAEGVFEIELHGTGTQIGRLVVEP